MQQGTHVRNAGGRRHGSSDDRCGSGNRIEQVVEPRDVERANFDHRGHTERDHGGPRSDPVPALGQFQLARFDGHAHDEHRNEDSKATRGRQADADQDSEKRFHDNLAVIAPRWTGLQARPAMKFVKV